MGWFATVIDGNSVRTETYTEFEKLNRTYSNADRILVDIPIGLPEDERRRCDMDAGDLLGSRGNSVFYPPCRRAAELSDYPEANEKHRENIGHGLSQQAHYLAEKILQVDQAIEDGYDGVVRESHPELCFAHLNGQPIAYSKSSAPGRALRKYLLSNEFTDFESIYQGARDDHLIKEVRRDDILDSMALAVAAREEDLATVPRAPSRDEPRIYYPDFEVRGLDVK
jgi:predicted RNase H-like nuclease